MMASSLAKDTILYLPAQLLGPLCQFAVTIVWTHMLDPSSFGFVTFIITAQEITGLIGLTWWSLFVVRFQLRYSGREGERFQAMDARVVILGMALQVLLAIPALALMGVAPSPVLLAATAAFLMTRTALAHFSEWARSNRRIAVYTLAQLVSPVVGSGLSIAAIWTLGPNPAVALGAMALGQGVGLAAVTIGLGRPWRWGRFDGRLFREARRYALPLLVSGVLAWMAANGVRVIVEAEAGIAGVGLFSAGWGLGQRLAVVLAMFCTAASFPLAVARLEAGDRHGAMRQVSNNGALMFGLLAPAVTGVTMLSEPLVRLLIAPQYQAATVVILPIAMGASALRMIRTHTGDQTGLLLERTSSMSVLNLIDAVLTLLGGALGAHFGDVIGAAIGCLAGTAIGSAASLGFTVVKLGLPVPAHAIGRVLIATVLMGSALSILPPATNAVGLVRAILIGSSVYLAAALLLFGEIRRDFVARLRGGRGNGFDRDRADRFRTPGARNLARRGNPRRVRARAGERDGHDIA
jgi:O-antigen/teichoic acid export membrane protein